MVVNRMDNFGDSVIAAISTGLSNSGIGIVRMSGCGSFRIADSVYKSKKNKKLCEQKSHTIHYGYVCDGEEIIDEVLVMLMRGPHSYTGEDTVEINCHGGVYVVRKILDTLIKYGARPAEPGEFTKRAFLNGRIDLSQAEAVGDIITAQNEYALQSSVHQLKGNIKEKINSIRDKIIYHTAFIESALDDPEHISVDGYGKKLQGSICEMTDDIEHLLSTYNDGKIMKEGIKTVIVGKPNAGKSSLLNTLIGEDRAIVTDIAGTTRDILEEYINLQGISLNIIDTAGIRNTEDTVEKIGVERAKEYVGQADLVLFVVDASLPLDENDYHIFEIIQGKQVIVLLNKSDLDMMVSRNDILKIYNELFPAKIKDREITELCVIEVSAKKKYGIDQFENQIKNMFFEGNLSFNDEIYITNARHKSALKDAYHSLLKVNESINCNLPEDFYSIDLMDAYSALGRITGESVGEDLVNEIFSKFCMGK